MTAPAPNTHFQLDDYMTQASSHSITVTRPTGDGPGTFGYQFSDDNNNNGATDSVSVGGLLLDVGGHQTYTGNLSKLSVLTAGPGGFIVEARTNFSGFGTVAYKDVNFMVDPPKQGGAPIGAATAQGTPQSVMGN